MSRSFICMLLFTGIMAMPLASYGQNNRPSNELEARQYLEKKGISEEEFRAAMLARGYDIDNIEPDAESIQNLQRVSTEVIDSLASLQDQETGRQVEKPRDDQKTDRKEEQVLKTRDTPGKTEAGREEPAAEEEPVSEIYGHDLFKNKDANVFRQVDNIRPPRSYVLGTGDELSVFINGPSQLQATARIDENGYFKIESYPPVPLRGLTVADAERLLAGSLRQYMKFNDNQFTVTVLSARNITVNMYGEVTTVGGITISAVNTLFNAVVAAGGPTDIGSVRKIKLISGEESREFDTYRFMQNPEMAEQFYLHDNDYIQIPVADRVVTIEGAVKRPLKYELLPDEHLNKLIEYAGGLNENAFQKDVRITRFGQDQRVVININLRELLDGGGDYLLQPGDVVSIRSLEEAVENIVEVAGAVMQEGTYERKEGMRVADILDRAILKSEARRDFAYILRYNPNGQYRYIPFSPESALSTRTGTANLELADRDIIRIPSQVEYSDSIAFYVTGAVRIPGEYGFDPAGILKVQDAILISGGLVPSAAQFGYITRRLPENPEKADYIPFNPQSVVTDISSADNHVLMPNDTVFIFDETDIRDDYFISVNGAVRNPGKFGYDENLTVIQAIRLAGGLRFDAASNRIEVARVVISENQPTRIESYMLNVDREMNFFSGDTSLVLMPFDQVYVRQVPDFELQRTVSLVGEVKYPGTYVIVSDNERLSSFIDRAGGLTPEAYPEGARLTRQQDNIGSVVISLDEALNKPNSTSNLVLMNGDSIDIPRRQELVTIQGAVNLRDYYPEEFIESGNRISVTHEKNKNARYYVNEYAAGLSEDGRNRLITVVHPNGRVEKTTNVLLFKVYPKVPPGGIVNVGKVEPKLTEAKETPKEEVDWGAVVRDTLAQAVAIVTLIVLIDRL